MYLVSIDVGVRHLALGYFHLSYDPFELEIIEWTTKDLLTQRCPVMVTRGSRKGYACQRSSYNGTPFCKSHCPSPFTCHRCSRKPKYHDSTLGQYACFQHKSESSTLFCIKKSDITTVCHTTIDFLDSLFLHKPIDQVIIEKQPRMATHLVQGLSWVLFTYFSMKHIPCSFVSSKQKGLEKTKTYTDRKRQSIQQCTQWLQQSECTWNEWSSAYKKDDLADVLLQAITYSFKQVKRQHNQNQGIQLNHLRIYKQGDYGIATEKEKQGDSNQSSDNIHQAQNQNTQKESTFGTRNSLEIIQDDRNTQPCVLNA